RDVPLFQDPKKFLKNVNDAKLEQFRKAYHLDVMDFAPSRVALEGSLVPLWTTMGLIAERADGSYSGPTVLPEYEALNKTKKQERYPEVAEGIVKKFDVSKDPKERWPELAMAHSDCFACHHDLQKSDQSFRQLRGYNVPLLDKLVLIGV